MTQKEAMSSALRFKQKLLDMSVPVQEVRLFGSMAKGTAHPYSDIDIAVICTAFLPTKHEENTLFRKARRDIDVRIETVCLHPEDMENKYFALAQEVKRHGIPV